jgi:hypothetical protein
MKRFTRFMMFMARMCYNLALYIVVKEKVPEHDSALTRHMHVKELLRTRSKARFMSACPMELVFLNLLDL